MPKYTLDKTWELCLEMWGGWVVVQIKAGTKLDVIDLKKVWAERHGHENIHANCFFCGYETSSYSSSYCSLCPGKLVDPNFSCCRDEYHYYRKPLLFHAELLRLNLIRTNP